MSALASPWDGKRRWHSARGAFSDPTNGMIEQFDGAAGPKGGGCDEVHI